mmetsp:Transcript_113273/g.366033  ORF Transcript_113273/g.366033 Transcript_113273/m.366033 type:complete len:269 (-) Transcript_113273:280-1086(-)
MSASILFVSPVATALSKASLIRVSIVERAEASRTSYSVVGFSHRGPRLPRCAMRATRLMPEGLASSASKASSLLGMSSAAFVAAISCTLGVSGSHCTLPPVGSVSCLHMLSMLPQTVCSTGNPSGSLVRKTGSSSMIFTEKAVQYCRKLDARSSTSKTMICAFSSEERTFFEPSRSASAAVILRSSAPARWRCSLHICLFSCWCFCCTCVDAPGAPAKSSCFAIRRRFCTGMKSLRRRSWTSSRSLTSLRKKLLWPRTRLNSRPPLPE